ncbi:MAG: fibronectin type III domain-containing protein, partial [Flavobacteriaceae bacterium]
MKKNALIFLLLMVGFCVKAQSVTYLSPLEQTTPSNADSPYVIPNGVVTNPDFNYLDPNEASKFTGSYVITASEMQSAGFVAGDNINSIAWELSQGQGESSTGVLSVFLVSTSFFPDFSQIPNMGFNVLPPTEITIPDETGMFEIDFVGPYLYDGQGLYITFTFTPTTYSSIDVLPLVGIDTNLSGGFRSRFVLSGDNEGVVIEDQSDSRPVTLLGKPDCPFGYVAFESHTEISATISWSGEGTYEIEYGLYPYEQGTGGVTLPQFTTNDTENEYIITGLEPGKAYNVYVKRICNDSESQWSQTIIGTSLESEVTEYPYSEGFDAEEQYTFLFTRGWSVPQSSTTYLDWTIAFQEEEGFLRLRDFQNQEVNKTVYSRPFYFEEGYTYPMSLDYRLDWFFNDFQDVENHPDLNILVNTSASEEGSTILASVENISNFDSQVLNFEFTPETSGVYYVGLNGFFAPHTSQITSTNYLIIDDFMVSECVLSVDDIERVSGIGVYPNPFNDFIRISSDTLYIDTIHIFDVKGSLLYENSINEK